MVKNPTVIMCRKPNRIRDTMAFKAALSFALVLTSANLLSRAYPKEETREGVGDQATETESPELSEMGHAGTAVTVLRPAGFNLKEWLQKVDQKLRKTARRVDKCIRKALNDTEPYLPLMLRHWLREHF
ncbi:hypothetical protein SprV_0802631000 [Sparganum proliferum]